MRKISAQKDPTLHEILFNAPVNNYVNLSYAIRKKYAGFRQRDGFPWPTGTSPRLNIGQ